MDIIKTTWHGLSEHSKSAIRTMLAHGVAKTTSHKVAKELASKEIAVVQCRSKVYIMNRVIDGKLQPKDFVIPCQSAFLFEPYI